MTSSASRSSGWLGQSIPRLEDRYLLTGRGQFVDDVARRYLLHVAFVRSEMAAADIRRVDAEAATGVEGVVAVLTADDLGPLAPLRAILQRSEFVPTEMPVIARDRVRHVGEPVAVVVADSRYAAENGAESVVVEYESRQAVGGVDWQVAGGVVQGIGSALFDQVVHDDAGQPLVTGLIDYLVPTATDVPEIEIHHLETPTPRTTTGAKRMGEGGAIGSPAAILNAVNDALAGIGVVSRVRPADIVEAIHRESSEGASRQLTGHPSGAPELKVPA